MLFVHGPGLDLPDFRKPGGKYKRKVDYVCVMLATETLKVSLLQERSCFVVETCRSKFNVVSHTNTMQ